jgi:hypothetical protein
MADGSISPIGFLVRPGMEGADGQTQVYLYFGLWIPYEVVRLISRGWHDTTSLFNVNTWLVFAS